ncbi:hypothetical protein D3C71_1393430 [compost metagenome]
MPFKYKNNVYRKAVPFCMMLSLGDRLEIGSVLGGKEDGHDYAVSSIKEVKVCLEGVVVSGNCHKIKGGI